MKIADLAIIALALRLVVEGTVDRRITLELVRIIPDFDRFVDDLREGGSESPNIFNCMN